MRKISFLILFLSLIYVPFTQAADTSTTHQFHGTGEVVSVDPVYSRITIDHAPIKGFAGGPETEFTVKSPDLLKKISKLDLVEFDIEETKGDSNIVKIEKTGQGTPKPEGVPVGDAARDVIQGAGNVVKTVTAPITPVSEAVGATTSATGTVVSDAKPTVDDGSVESRTKF